MEELKEQMEFKFMTEGLTPEVVELSQRLDEHILQEQLVISIRLLIIDIRESLFQYGLLEEKELEEYIWSCMEIDFPPKRRTQETFDIVKAEILRSCYININELIS